MTLDKYFQKYYDSLASQGLPKNTIDERIKDSGWVHENYDNTEAFVPEASFNDFVITIQNKKEVGNPAVLITTGAFDPVHDGHIEMMDKAKKVVENNGYNVIAGIMSSGHDNYVRKRKNHQGMNVFDRCISNENFIKSHSLNKDCWLFHDRWESLIAKESVNFTTVVDQIKELTRFYCQDFFENISFFYVMGGDNAEFSHAFVDTDVIPIVIKRKGYCLSQEIIHLINNNQVLYAINDNNVSSSIIRSEKVHEKPYAIRQDLCASTKYLSVIDDYDKRIESFRLSLYKTLKNNKQGSAEIMGIDVNTQMNKTLEMISQKYYSDKKFISADKYFFGKNVHRVQCSRVFNVGTEQYSADNIFINSDELDSEQEYVFIDDDIATGFTLENLKKHFNIIDSISMLKIMIPYGVEDVVDERDFLVGAENGGLVCLVNDGYIRYPYMLPYVNPSSRASIASDNVCEFSRALWKLNKEFYFGTNIQVKDLRNNEFFKTVLVDENTYVSEFCEKMEKVI